MPHQSSSGFHTVTFILVIVILCLLAAWILVSLIWWFMNSGYYKKFLGAGEAALKKLREQPE